MESCRVCAVEGVMSLCHGVSLLLDGDRGLVCAVFALSRRGARASRRSGGTVGRNDAVTGSSFLTHKNNTCHSLPNVWEDFSIASKQSPHLGASAAHPVLQSSSHDTDHLVAGRLSHEPLVNNPGHIVSASTQSGSWQTFWLELIHATEASSDERVSRHSLGLQDDASLAPPAAHILQELLDEAPEALSVWVRCTDRGAGGFPRGVRVSHWTGT